MKPRTTDDGLKSGPCGGKAKGTPQEFKSGQTVEVRWEETVQHPGWYEFRFSPDGSNFSTLLKKVDDSQDRRDDLPHRYQTTLTLPDVECASCVIQFIQVMTDRNPATNYYSCGDVRLSRTAPVAPPPPPVVTVVPAQGATPVAGSPAPAASEPPTAPAHGTHPTTGLPAPGRPRFRWVEGQ